MRIRRGYLITFLFFVVLGVYYPALFSGINSVDDWRMFYELENLMKGDFWTFFMPTSGFYYRPLLMLTFCADYLLWGEEASFYHLGNILLHAANVYLIYILSEKVIKDKNQKNHQFWPLLTALIFAVHPIATESVNWISGRTDLLGTFFVLVSVYLLVSGIQKKKLFLIVAAVVASCLAILSKEIMVFALPVGAFLIWRFSGDYPRDWRVKAELIFGAPFICLGAIYFILRATKYGAGSGFSSIINNYHYGVFDTFRVFFKVLGFYFKKILIPWPLNFAITNVNDNYVWLGLVVIVLVGFLLKRKSTGAVFLIVGIFLIVPGILVALLNIAWTPLAERYIYLPTVFSILGLMHILSTLPKSSRGHNNILVCLSLILVPAVISTTQRNIIWQDNESLYADSIRKTPEFAAMNNELAIALIASGNFEKAEEILSEGKKLPNASPLLYINQTRIFLAQGDIKSARNEILSICSDKGTANLEALKTLARVDEQRLMKGEPFEVVAPDLFDTYIHLSKRSNDPFFDYRLGQLMLKLGDNVSAADYFREAYQKAPEDAYYRSAAGKLAERLAKKE